MGGDFLDHVNGRSLEMSHHGAPEAREVWVTLMNGCAHFAQHLRTEQKGSCKKPAGLHKSVPV